MMIRSLFGPRRFGGVSSDDERFGAHVPNEVLIRLKDDGALAAEGAAWLERAGAVALERLDFPSAANSAPQAPILRLTLRADVSVAEAIARLTDAPEVAYAVPNHIYTLQSEGKATPDDLPRTLWGLHNEGGLLRRKDADIDAPEAWTVATGSRNGPLVAILDTGADYRHPDLDANIWTNPGEVAGDGLDNDGNGVIDDVHGYNAYADTGDPMDGNGHGTHVAGTIGAEGNNGIGVVGVNWEARMMPVKIFNDRGRTTADAIIRGINYATFMGARVTNNSWGGGEYSQAIYDAFAASPALHVVAAGNELSNNDRRPSYPASYDLDNILSVASSNAIDRLSYFSNYGKQSVDLAAPGSGIRSTYLRGRYARLSGTSMAAPHVTGALALLLSHEPGLSNAAARERLLSTVDRKDAFEGKVASGGRLNVARLLGAARD
jgi:subtilisin family serine protease